MERLDVLREQIDKIDDEIIKLLKKRLLISKDVGNLKKEIRKKVNDPNREERIIERLSKDIDEEFVKELYQVIFKYSKRKQEN